jgi:ABC-type sugar transport system ATPase subunit
MRPEALSPSADGLPSFEFLVDVVEPLGDEVVVHGTAQGETVETGAEEKEEREIRPAVERSRVPITARFDPGVRLAPGERLRLGLRPERVYLFDARTGAAIR